MSILKRRRVAPVVVGPLVVAPVLLALVFAWGGSPAAAGSTISLGISVSAPVPGTGALNPATALFLAAAAGFFGADSSGFVQYSAVAGGGAGYDPGPSLAAFYLARDAGVDTTAVWSVHRSGTSWWAWATRYGLAGRYVKLVPAGKLKKGFHKGKAYYYVPDRDFEQVMAVRFLADYYGMPSSRVWTLVASSGGLGFADVFIAVNLAGHAGVAPESVLEQRRRGLSWDGISERFSLPRGSWAYSEDEGRDRGQKAKKHGHGHGDGEDD